jgi:itaconate CoA-transferase
LIEQVFAELTAEDVIARLDAAGIANARLNTPEEVWNHEQLKARDRWREVGSPVGSIPAVLPPASFDGIEARMDPIPSIGQHTDSILAELGYTESEVETLKRGAAV